MRRLIIITSIFSFLFAQDYQSEIQPIWDNSCTGSCHVSGNANGGLNLTPAFSYSKLVNVASQGYSGFQRVKPGDPANSVLFQKIVGNTAFGNRMPPSGGNLSQADEDKIKKWIDEGAKQSWGSSTNDYAFDFGKSQSQIEVDPPIEGEQNWSIEFWVKFHQKPASGQWTQLVHFSHHDNNDNLFYIEFDGSDDQFNVIAKDASDGSTFKDDGVFDNQWHHFFVSGDGSKIKVFVDGNEKLSRDYTDSFYTSNKKMTFGMNLDGNMDEVRIRKKSNFTGVPTASYGPEEGTLLTWDFNDQSTTQVTDESGHGNHGAFVGGTPTYEPGVYSGGGGGGGHTLTVDVEFNEDHPFGQLWFGIWEEGNDQTVTPIYEHRVGEDPGPPFPFIRSYGLNWALEDGKDYFIGGFFDLNNNNIPDGNEPIGVTPLFTWPVSQSIKLVMEDMMGPEIQINDLTGLNAREGEDLEVIVGINSPHNVQSAKIEYYVNGSSQMSTISMSNSGGDSWRGTISGSEVNIGGLLLEVVAEDSRGMDSFSGIHEVEVEFDGLGGFSPHKEYQMISIPGRLQNTSISAVLNDLGEADPKKWRLFRWTGNGYAENSGSFTPGSTFWLITEGIRNFKTGSGKSTPLTNPPSINLTQGWNMVGMPFGFSMSLSNTKLDFEGDIEEMLHRYNGSGYSPANALYPGEGYWIFANSPGRITFDFLTDISGSHTETNDESDESTSFNWVANISAKISDYEDRFNTFGVHPESKSEWDKLDLREPPVIGDYISVAFDNNHWSDRDGRYSRDIRPEHVQVQSWALSAKTNLKGIVSLELEDLNAIPAYLDIRLIDTALGLAYNLRDKKEVTFTSQGTENPYYFQLMVGPSDDVQDQLDDLGMIPQSFELAQNSPNPFNPVTNIRVSLVEDANITLKVYNLLGEELNAIAVNQSLGKGNHRFIWAGKDDHGHQLPSGIYLYRLEVKSHSGNRLYQNTKKMVLMK